MNTQADPVLSCLAALRERKQQITDVIEKLEKYQQWVADHKILPQSKDGNS